LANYKKGASMKPAKLLSFFLVLAILTITTSASASSPNSFFAHQNHTLINPPNWSFETDQNETTIDRALFVSSGCDVNGDGYDDILVGDIDYDTAQVEDSGRAWLFMGSAAGLSSTPDTTFDPPLLMWHGLFATNVACAGDVNGDGYDDLMIGMRNYYPNDAQCPNCYDEGAEFVYYGSPTGPNPTQWSWMARGNEVWGFMGTYADSADVNGDGYDDIIIGTGENHEYAIAHAYVWYGGPGGLGDDGLGGTSTNADWVAADPNPRGIDGDWFGDFVYGIGDVNGDSFDDVMITACCSFIQDQNQYPGAVYVYYGSSTGLSINPDWGGTGDKGGSRFGVGGDGVGDLNGDGYGDLAVGADCGACSQPDGGHVYVWYGSASGLGASGTPSNADWDAQGVSNSLLGIVTRPAGDIDHDSYADLLVTASNYNVPTPGGMLYGAGAWFIWKGSKAGLGEPGTPYNADIIAQGDQAGAALGAFEAGAGDVNNDGLDDIFVAAYLYSDPETNEGAVFGYYSPIPVWNLFYLPLTVSSP
jgi:hypothetical protein